MRRTKTVLPHRRELGYLGKRRGGSQRDDDKGMFSNAGLEPGERALAHRRQKKKKKKGRILRRME